MVEKVKINLKHLDISINIAYNIFTFSLVISFFILIAIAKFVVITTTQAHIVQTKIIAQACAFF